MHALVDACKKNGPTVSLFPLILPGSLASQLVCGCRGLGELLSECCVTTAPLLADCF